MSIVLDGTSGITTNSGTVVSTTDATLNGLTVGKGGGSVSTNTAVGASALAGTNTGGLNTGVGYQALQTNTSGVSNTAFGYLALNANTTATYNTAIGDRALRVSTGDANTACGGISLYSNTTGARNTAVGEESLFNNTTANSNTAVGYQAGYTTSLGLYNTFIGTQAGYTSAVNGNAGNTCVGFQSGYGLTTGIKNTFIGGNANVSAGYYVTTGSSNTIIGGYTGNLGGLDIRTASNYIVLSDGDGNPRGIFGSDGELYVGITGKAAGVANAWFQATTTNSKSGIAISANVNGANAINWYSAANTYLASIVLNSGSVSYNTSSDYRLKENIAPMTGALDKVSQLKPVTFKWKSDGADAEGFIAHELAEVCPHAVSGEKDAVDEEGNPKYQGVDTSFLVATLTSAIQELKALVDAQATEIAELKAKVA